MLELDYSRLLDQPAADAYASTGLLRCEHSYNGADGVRFQTTAFPSKAVDIVRLSPNAFLVSSEDVVEAVSQERQIVGEHPWIHLQVRLDGGGRERLDRIGAKVETPAHSCIAIRYPRDATIVREADVAQTWRAVCLYIRPDSISPLLQLPAGSAFAGADWLTSNKMSTFRAQRLLLQPAMASIAGDILRCGYKGPIRHAYMRAKSIELTCAIIDALSRPGGELPTQISASDLRRIRSAREIIESTTDQLGSLAELAHSVGLNRTKLAAGFKLAYGNSVHAYWRSLQLERARYLLVEGECSVTEAGLIAGYNDLSAFSRAYRRRFGVPPRRAAYHNSSH